jgi:predicted small secreted protein
MIKRIGTWLLVGIFILSIVGCNTVEGMGEDIEAAGESINDAAED